MMNKELMKCDEKESKEEILADARNELRCLASDIVRSAERLNEMLVECPKNGCKLNVDVDMVKQLNSLGDALAAEEKRLRDEALASTSDMGSKLKMIKEGLPKGKASSISVSVVSGPKGKMNPKASIIDSLFAK